MFKRSSAEDTPYGTPQVETTKTPHEMTRMKPWGGNHELHTMGWIPQGGNDRGIAFPV